MLVSKKMCVLCNGDQPLIPGMNYKGEYLEEHLKYHHKKSPTGTKPKDNPRKITTTENPNGSVTIDIGWLKIIIQHDK